MTSLDLKRLTYAAFLAYIIYKDAEKNGYINKIKKGLKFKKKKVIKKETNNKQTSLTEEDLEWKFKKLQETQKIYETDIKQLFMLLQKAEIIGLNKLSDEDWKAIKYYVNKYDLEKKNGIIN